MMSDITVKDVKVRRKTGYVTVVYLEDGQEKTLVVTGKDVVVNYYAVEEIKGNTSPLRIPTVVFNKPEPDILEPIRRAVYNVKREGFEVVKIHVTRDFKARVTAKVRPLTDVLGQWRILGIPVEIHEAADMDWWIEDNTLGLVKV